MSGPPRVKYPQTPLNDSINGYVFPSKGQSACIANRDTQWAEGGQTQGMAGRSGAASHLLKRAITIAEASANDAVDIGKVIMQRQLLTYLRQAKGMRKTNWVTNLQLAN